MNKILLLVIFIGIGYLTARSENVSDNPLIYNEKNVLNLNGTWDFKYIPSVKTGSDSLFYTKNFDVSDWANIQVPGHWELQGFAEPSYSTVKEGTGLYRTSFMVPNEWKNRQVFIQFDGVLYAYDVFVNGHYVGNWTSAFNSRSFEISRYIDFSGENILGVRVTTRSHDFEFDISDCWGLSGIFRDVFLFDRPQTCILDYTVRTKIAQEGLALVEVAVDLNQAVEISGEQFQLKGILISPCGNEIVQKIPVKTEIGNQFRFKIKSPDWWTAETPSLYKLKLQLFQNGHLIQEKNQMVGIREISIDQAVVKLNGSPLKLRGVNHHDLVPETGRTMSRQQILKDLLLIKEANINFIRTSHYPPNHCLLDMCDSLGIYVDCEVPFNYGRRLLTDPNYQDDLLKRAKATLLRDKNHPCIVFWSIGNENPSTPITEETGRFVKQQDPTRPICFAGLLLRSEKRPNIRADEPDFVDISSSHYKSVEWIIEKTGTTKKPVVLTEYAHALGSTFGNMKDTWGEMFRNPKMLGGAVWMFQDQGIMRKSDHAVDVHKLTQSVWVDSLYYYDCNALGGVDGIVYADRTPQTDYWQVRKVYSPIQIIEKRVPVNSGSQTISLSVYNQYDFLNLNSLQGKWTLLKNREIYQQGQASVNCLPHDTVSWELPLVLPENQEKDVWLLRFEYKDKTGMPVYEHTLNLLPAQGLDKVKQEICLPEKSLQKTTSGVTVGNFEFDFSPKDFSLKLVDLANQKELICGGIYARTGRVATINDEAINEKQNGYLWNPFLLSANQLKEVVETKTATQYNLSGRATFLRGDQFPGQQVSGDIAYTVSNDGTLTVRYDLKPENATGNFLEAGVSFVLPENISDFIWLGDGPYPSFPDKHLLSGLGIHYLKKGDLYFTGNRANVEVAVLTDREGNGIAIIGDRSNIAVECVDGKIIVSHNALVSGKGNKKTKPISAYRIEAGSVKQISGTFRIVPLQANHWPKKLIEILGGPDKSKKPFAPFYHSYDWPK